MSEWSSLCLGAEEGDRFSAELPRSIVSCVSSVCVYVFSTQVVHSSNDSFNKLLLTIFLYQEVFQRLGMGGTPRYKQIKTFT